MGGGHHRRHGFNRLSSHGQQGSWRGAIDSVDRNLECEGFRLLECLDAFFICEECKLYLDTADWSARTSVLQTMLDLFVDFCEARDVVAAPIPANAISLSWVFDDFFALHAAGHLNFVALK